jgi:hypothetical protein
MADDFVISIDSVSVAGDKVQCFVTAKTILDETIRGFTFMADFGKTKDETVKNIKKEIIRIAKLIAADEAYFLNPPDDPGDVSFLTKYEVVVDVENENMTVREKPVAEEPVV